MKKILLSAFAVMISTSAFSQSWVTQNSGFTTASRGISGMEVYDTNTAWAYAYDGVTSTNNIQEFTKTSNGGTTWTAGTIELGDPTLTITNISGISGTTAWIGAVDSTLGLGGVWKTTDGGVTWVNQLTMNTANQSYMNVVHFFDANNGMAMGDPEGGEFEIYTTTNGGTTWTRVPAANVVNPLTGEYGYTGGYYAVGNNIFFYTGKGRIYKSVDKGLNWTIAFTGSAYGISDFGSATVSGDMAWSDANKGVVLKKNFTGTTPTAIALYRTTDGGTTWNSVTFTGITAANKVTDITYVPGTSILLAASSAGGSWKSTDDGTTWTSIDTGVQHLSVRCSSASNCYSGGFNTSAISGGMFKLSSSLGTNDLSVTAKSTSIYPNPTKGEINIKSDSKVKSTTVFDLSGKKLLQTSSDKVNIGAFVKGTYLVKVDFADGSTKTEKVIKD